MRRQPLLFLITILSFNCYSQISFEKGYYINDSDQKVECLIKNVDWKNNPTKFEYKLTEDSEKKIATTKTIKEFGVLNASKYRRCLVNIDRSRNTVGEMSNHRKPVFKEEVLFLKVLIEGKASLYSFEDGNLNRYFYNKDNAEVEQLVFKYYLTPNDQVRENKRYKQQLFNDLKCSNVTIDKVENVDYNKGDLINFFVEYNKCSNEEFINFEKKQKKNLFNLSIRPGFSMSSLSIDQNVSNLRDTDFDSEMSFRFGVEAELIMPFNKNKWTVILEPTYQHFKSEKELTTQNVKADYKSIELPIGVRHYFFLNENSKIFVNGSYIIDFSSNSVVDFEFGTDLEIKTRNNLAFGVGYKYNNRYSLEMRYHTNREVLYTHPLWDSDFRSFSIILGYALF